MKHIKPFKLYESGEWNRKITWEYVKNNPEDDSEESNMIFFLSETLSDLIMLLDKEEYFTINDIRGYDIYQGAYAHVNILGKNYKIWMSGERDSDIFIEDFPIDNCTERDCKAGFVGTITETAILINDIVKSGGFEIYKTSKKYNL